jgi:hypothetical protein
VIFEQCQNENGGIHDKTAAEANDQPAPIMNAKRIGRNVSPAALTGTVRKMLDVRQSPMTAHFLWVALA